MQEDKITAPILADKFEVSRRTINRDIEDLCRAGIPIVTTQGAGGGISIMEGYRMDRTILTSKDMQMIMSGLRSLDSVSGSHYYGQLMDKIKAGSAEYVSGRESILIDLSCWDKESLSPKIELIQQAIEDRKVISFCYYSPKGDEERKVEPYYLIFKWSSWYVWGFCKLRNDFRIFKLNRMGQLQLTCEDVVTREVPVPDLSSERVFPGGISVKAVFEASMKWHLIEEFVVDSFTELPDGRLLFEHEYSDEDYLIEWILKCRDQVEVLEPEHIRKALFRIADKIRQQYE